MAAVLTTKATALLWTAGVAKQHETVSDNSEEFAQSWTELQPQV